MDFGDFANGIADHHLAEKEGLTAKILEAFKFVLESPRKPPLDYSLSVREEAKGIMAFLALPQKTHLDNPQNRLTKLLYLRQALFDPIPVSKIGKIFNPYREVSQQTLERLYLPSDRRGAWLLEAAKSSPATRRGLGVLEDLWSIDMGMIEWEQTFSGELAIEPLFLYATFMREMPYWTEESK